MSLLDAASGAPIPPIHVSGPASRPFGMPREDLRRLLLDARDRLDALLETWTWAAEAVRTGSHHVDPIRRGGQIDDHLIWDLGHAHANRRISRTDGARGDRRRPVVRLGRAAAGEPKWEVRLHGRVRPCARMADATDLLAIEDGVEAISMAGACIDAALHPVSGPEAAAACSAMEAVAHEEAALREGTHGVPPHLRPTIVALAPTPWSAAAMRLVHPHKGRDERITASTVRTLPFMVTMTILGEGIDLAPHRVGAPAGCDPVARLRILSDIDRLAPAIARRPRAA